MKKYYIGLAVIALFTLGIAGFTIYQGASSKQDVQTEKKSQELATKLNNYVTKNQEIPSSLDILGVKDIPSTITYSKKSENKYEFCVTYKQKSDLYGSGDFSSIVYGSLQQDLASREGSGDEELSVTDTRQSYLYLPYYHKAGKNCQTIEPYLYGNYDYFNDYNPFSKNSTTSKNKNDTERETDIKALQGQIEAYYAQNGKYPTLTDINSASFRSANMKGLDSGALKDPEGASSTLVSKPGKNVYSYEVDAGVGKTCDNKATDCSYYILTATLSDSSEYTKEALN